VSFEEAAAIALGNSQLRRNLAHATQTIRTRRAAAVAELPDWQELRDAGSDAKDRALSRLDKELVRLAEQVEDAGGRVHWARDGVEARQIVVGIVRQHDAEHVVKVKSITAEEIGLNQALESAGINAVETDLAELILQLSSDSSSHILVPAIHRNRAEIRDIFRHTIGPRDLTDDPAALCEAARSHLRRRFLSARVGLSGANFAVAETGTVGVVESEGNGRMCLTLPEVLITVMGIEKVVSQWSDLEVFLQLLPRSATGEPMNPYTTLWTGVHPGDGPREFHLVLLDNGRSGVLADHVGRQTLRCIRCSACLNSCPVYTRTGGHAYESVYPGPIGAILSPQLFGPERSGSLPYSSTLCGACYDVCPVKIDIPRVLIHLRSRMVEQRQAPKTEMLTMRALAKCFSSRRRYEALQRAGLLGTRLLAADGGPRRFGGAVSAWTSVRDLPTPPKQTFRDWWYEHHTAIPADETSTSLRTTARHREAIQERSAPRQAPLVSRERATESDARTEILHRLHTALSDVEVCPDVVRRYRRCAPVTRSKLSARFAMRAAELGTHVVRTPERELSSVLGELCRRQEASRMVVAPELPDAWAPANVNLVTDLGLAVAELDEVDGALTGCALAIADTGTIVLDGAATQGRRAVTLVPDYHLCVVREDQIVGLVPQAVQRLEPAVRNRRPLTFITGPSATSDIELSRVEGVHGPRTLHVVVVGAAIG
jgi:iron-sulfur cluster protein